MQPLIRTISLSYLALVLIMIAIKAFVPLPAALGYAPVPLALGPASQPITLVVWHSPEQQRWLEAATQRFIAQTPTTQGRPIQVRLVAIESGTLIERVATQTWQTDPRPHVIIPASTIWLDQLPVDAPVVRSGDDAPRPLAFTPLVTVAWEDRANLLWAGGQATFWRDLATASAQPEGWAGVALANGFAAESAEVRRAREWGAVKFGHPSPLQTNTGLQTLILMAYAYHDKRTDLSLADVQDPGFRDWLRSVAADVLDLNAPSAAFMEDLARFGPSKYDLVITDEASASGQLLAAQGRWNQQIRVYYPPATLVSDFPFALLDAPLTSAPEQSAARTLRAFLSTAPIQELALQHGMRPAALSVPIVSGAADNPFTRYAPFGLRADLGPQVETPAPAVVAALRELWQNAIAAYTLQ